MEKNSSKRERNKQEHREAILEAAESLFIQKGFDGASIDDVARQAGLTKRTLYQYFTSKEDLFFAVALKGGRQLTSAYEEALSLGGPAQGKIRRANEAYLKFYENFPGMFRLLNYQPSNRQSCQQSPHFREMEQLTGLRVAHYLRLVEECRADGSIDPALDARKAVFFAFFAAFSLLLAVSSADQSMWRLLELEDGDFLKFSFGLISDALRAPENRRG